MSSPRMLCLTIRTWALLCLLGTACVQAIAAGTQKSAVLMVNTTVLPMATAEVRQPESLVVSSKELDKGVIRVPGKDNPDGGQFKIKSNSPAGYTVTFSLQADMAKRIQSATLRGMTGPVTITANAPATVDLPVSSSSVVYKLNYEFVLNKEESAGMTPGSYLWPVLITLQPR